jgi:opacity protein-like surface antigen
MKKYAFAIVSTLLLSAGAAQAETAGITDNAFVSVLGGWSSHPDLSFGSTHTRVDDGYNVGARVGTWLDLLPGFTVDADYFFNRSDLPGKTAHMNSSSVMGDLIYHLQTNMPLGLYGGAGLGLVNDNLSGSLHGGSAVLGWQAIGGAEFPLSDGTALFAEYRYQNAHDANIGAIRNVGNTSNNVSLGIKFHL